MSASRNSLERRHAQARAIAGVVATGLLLGAAATLMLRASGDASAAVTPATPAATQPVAAKPVATQPVAAKPVATQPVAAKPVATQPVAAKPVATQPVAVKPVATQPVAAKPVAAQPVAAKPVAAQPVAVKPVDGKTAAAKPANQVANATPRMSVTPAAPVTAVKPAVKPVAQSPGVQPVANLDDQITYQYNALGRRDPFMPMLGGEYVGGEMSGDGPVDIGGMTVVGIVWGSDDKFALIEDGKGNSEVLRIGDKVMNGVVEGLRRDAVVVRLTVDGQSQSVAIPLTRKGDRSDAKR